MKIVIRQQISLSGDISVFESVYKTFESNVIPHKGDYIYEAVFDDPEGFEVNKVKIDYADDSCWVWIRPYIIESSNADKLGQYVQSLLSQGWKC